MEEFLLKYQVKPRLHTEPNPELSPNNTNIWCVCLCVTGPTAAAVRGRGRDEDVRQGKGQCQPTHIPP